METQINANLSLLLDKYVSNKIEDMLNQEDMENINNQEMKNEELQDLTILNTNEEETQNMMDSGEVLEAENNLYKIEKKAYKLQAINIKKAVEIETSQSNEDFITVVDESTINTPINVGELNTPVNLIKIEKYQLKKHPVLLKK